MRRESLADFLHRMEDLFLDLADQSNSERRKVALEGEAIHHRMLIEANSADLVRQSIRSAA